MSRKAIATLALVVLAAASPVFAQLQTVFQDDFEAGLSAWTTASGCTPLVFSTAHNIVPAGGVRSAYADLSQDRMYHNLGEVAGAVRATWYIYDDSMTRAYGQLISHTGSGYGVGTNDQLYAAGKYNNVTMPGEVWKANKYQGRVLYPSATMGWFNLDALGSPNRSAGWHKFTLERTGDTMVRFYVDDIHARTITGANWTSTVDSTTIGFGNSSTSNGDAWYDGVLIETMRNVLSLNVAGSVYLRPGQTLTVRMDVSDLAQPVSGVQALIGYSSTYFPTAGSVAPGGGGIWEELIYEVWNVGAGELDTAVGVKLGTSPGGGTQLNATTAYINLTAGTTEGLTKLVFRPDGIDGYATMFSDTNAQPVMPYKRDSQMVLIDGTPPTGVTISANPPGWTNASTVNLTFGGSDALSGIDRFEIQIDSGAFAPQTSPYALNVSAMADGTHTATVKAFDRAGNTTTATTSFYLDKTKPSIAITSAKQSGVELIPSGTALQGVVNIKVTASDATSGLNGHPAVTVTPSGGTAEAAAYVNESPVGTFNYTWSVTASTPNGTATINASVVDNATNSQTATPKTFVVNKNQVSGTIAFDTFSASAFSLNRDVVIVATDAGGSVLKTWTPTIAFTNNTSSLLASGTYTLTDVPAAIAGLSAKTAWSLREKKAVVLDSNGQAVIDFTGIDKLRGGDLDASNLVNILDYSILKSSWNSAAPAADINGDGQVQLLDYSILRSYWFQAGDPQ